MQAGVQTGLLRAIRRTRAMFLIPAETGITGCIPSPAMAGFWWGYFSRDAVAPRRMRSREVGRTSACYTTSRGSRQIDSGAIPP
jgi:hypothetical protein